MEFSVLNFVFYLFSFLVIFSAAMVISAKNPVHSVLFLIFTFFNAAGLFVLLGTEYLAMTLVIVYVGAVAVLFLFVVMMMNVDFSRWREGFAKQLPVGILVAVLLLVHIGLVYYASYVSAPVELLESVDTGVTNTEAIGRVLYTDYVYIFIISGMVLLVAMIGAIVLTMRERDVVKHQDIGKQLRRTRGESVDLVDVKSGEGVTL